MLELVEGVGRIRGATPVVSLLTAQPPQPVANLPTLMLMPPYSSAYCLFMGYSPCLHDNSPAFDQPPALAAPKWGRLLSLSLLVVVTHFQKRISHNNNDRSY